MSTPTRELHPLLKRIVDLCRARGLNAWTSHGTGSTIEQVYFTDGKRICTAHVVFHQVALTTVHKPSAESGSGYRYKLLNEAELIPEYVLACMGCLAPTWAERAQVARVRKYSSFQEFLTERDGSRWSTIASAWTTYGLTGRSRAACQVTIERPCVREGRSCVLWAALRLSTSPVDCGKMKIVSKKFCS